MNKALRKELITLCAGTGLLCLLGQKKKSATLFLGAGAALYLQGRTLQTDSFRGQRVLITGGSRGLGFALARGLLKEGAAVGLIARDETELRQAEVLLRREFPQAKLLSLPTDVTREHELKEAFHRFNQAWGGLDMLMNVAGAISVGPYETMERADFEAQMELHFYAVMNAINFALPSLRKSQGRRIVNICSMGGKVAVPHMLPYDTSKFALSGYSQGVMAELAPEKISVTTVYPALMRTGSPIQAVFKGDHEKEFAWFATGDVLPGLSLSADKAAQKIIEAARERRTELTPSWAGRLRAVGAAFFPETVACLMKAMALFLPRGTSRTRKTGAESRAFFDSQGWLAPVRIASHVVEKMHNQSPKLDADFNLGLKASEASENNEAAPAQ